MELLLILLALGLTWWFVFGRNVKGYTDATEVVKYFLRTYHTLTEKIDVPYDLYLYTVTLTFNAYKVHEGVFASGETSESLAAATMDKALSECQIANIGLNLRSVAYYAVIIVLSNTFYKHSLSKRELKQVELAVFTEIPIDL